MDTASHAPGQNLLGGDAQTLRPNSVRPVSLAHLREHLQGLGAQVSSQLASGVQGSESGDSVEVTGISIGLPRRASAGPVRGSARCEGARCAVC